MDEQCRGRAGPRGPDEPSETPPRAQGSHSGPSRAGEVQTSRLAGDWPRGHCWRQPHWGGEPSGRPPSCSGCLPFCPPLPSPAGAATEGLRAWSRHRKGRGVRKRVSGALGSRWAQQVFADGAFGVWPRAEGGLAALGLKGRARRPPSPQASPGCSVGQGPWDEERGWAHREVPPACWWALW